MGFAGPYDSALFIFCLPIRGFRYDLSPNLVLSSPLIFGIWNEWINELIVIWFSQSLQLINSRFFHGIFFFFWEDLDLIALFVSRLMIVSHSRFWCRVNLSINFDPRDRTFHYIKICRRGMEFFRKVPSLVELCTQTAIVNLRYMADVGEMDLHLLKDILRHCNIDQLTHIENSTEVRAMFSYCFQLCCAFCLLVFIPKLMGK